MLKALRAHAQGDVKPVLLPERDDHVELVLRRWDEVRELAELPLPGRPRGRAPPAAQGDAAAGSRARPASTRRGPSPADSIETLRTLDLRPPFLLKPVEGQHFAGSVRREGAGRADDRDELVAPWKRAKERGFDTVVQELVPDSRRAGSGRCSPTSAAAARRCATATGVQGAPGAAPLRHERRLPHHAAAARARARAAPARERGLPGLRPGRVRPRPARRRLQAARGEHARADVGRGRDDAASFDIARIAYDDLCGKPEPEPVDLQQRALVGVLRQGPLRLAADGAAARADARRLRRARTCSGTRCAASSRRTTRCRRSACLGYAALEDRLMRIALLDPPSFTVPYDHALASALGAPRPRRHAADRAASPTARCPSPTATAARRSSCRSRRGSSAGRPLARAARAQGARVRAERGAAAAAGASGSTRTSSTSSGSRSRATTCTGWAALRRAARPDRPRRAARGASATPPPGSEVLETGGARDRPVGAGGRAAGRGSASAREKLVRIQHPVFESGVAATPPSGRTILFFGLIRDYKGLDVLLRGAARDPGRAARGRRRPARPGRAAAAAGGRARVADRVEWRLGFLPDEEIPQLMAEATLVALPYRQDRHLRRARDGARTRSPGGGDRRRRPARRDRARVRRRARSSRPSDAQALAAALRELLERGRAAEGLRRSRGRAPRRSPGTRAPPRTRRSTARWPR